MGGVGKTGDAGSVPADNSPVGQQPSVTRSETPETIADPAATYEVSSGSSKPSKAPGVDGAFVNQRQTKKPATSKKREYINLADERARGRRIGYEFDEQCTHMNADRFRVLHESVRPSYVCDAPFYQGTDDSCTVEQFTAFLEKHGDAIYQEYLESFEAEKLGGCSPTSKIAARLMHESGITSRVATSICEVGLEEHDNVDLMLIHQYPVVRIEGVEYRIDFTASQFTGADVREGENVGLVITPLSSESVYRNHFSDRRRSVPLQYVEPRLAESEQQLYEQVLARPR